VNRPGAVRLDATAAMTPDILEQVSGMSFLGGH
jgi:hypothetical protein